MSAAGRDVAEMMAAWATIEKAVAERYPVASADERYTLAAKAMAESMGLTGLAMEVR